MTKFIQLGNAKLATNKKYIVDSLFQSGGTVVGYLRKFKNHVGIYNLQDEKIGIINRERVIGSATRVNGKYWYSYGSPAIIGDIDSLVEEDRQVGNVLKVMDL